MKLFNCKNCGKENPAKLSTTNTYCNNQCQFEWQRDNNISEWLAGGPCWLHKNPNWVRWFLMLRDGDGCNICGITTWNQLPIVLECDHVDGNSTNCHPNNLRLLCPNCHSQTPTFRGKNKGNGRISRRRAH